MHEIKAEQRHKITNYSISMVLSSFGFMYGFYLGILNPLTEPLMQIVYKYDLKKDATTVSLIEALSNGLFAAGMIFGSLVYSWMADKFGRRGFNLICDLFAFLATWLMVFASIPVFIVARFLIGIYCGAVINLSPVTVKEIFPGQVIAFGNSFIGLYFQLGLLVAFMTQNVMTFEQLGANFRYILVVPSIIPALRLFAVLFFFRYESCHYLFIRYVKSDQEYMRKHMRLSLDEVFQLSEERRESELEVMIKKFKREIHSPKVTFKMLLSREYRAKFISGLMNVSANQLCGNVAITIYSNRLFSGITKSESSQKTMTLTIGIVALIGSIISLYTGKIFGRKPQLVMGALFQCLFLAMIIAGSLIPSDLIVLIALIGFNLAYTLGPSSALLTYLSETSPPVGQGVAMGFNSFLVIVMTQLSFLLTSAGKVMMFIFFVIALLMFFLLDYFNIETKDKSSVEINEMFVSRKEYTFLSFLCEKSSRRRGNSERSTSTGGSSSRLNSTGRSKSKSQLYSDGSSQPKAIAGPLQDSQISPPEKEKILESRKERKRKNKRKNPRNKPEDLELDLEEVQRKNVQDSESFREELKDQMKNLPIATRSNGKFGQTELISEFESETGFTPEVRNKNEDKRSRSGTKKRPTSPKSTFN